MPENATQRFGVQVCVLLDLELEHDGTGNHVSDLTAALKTGFGPLLIERMSPGVVGACIQQIGAFSILPPLVPASIEELKKEVIAAGYTEDAAERIAKNRFDGVYGEPARYLGRVLIQRRPEGNGEQPA